MKLLFIGSFGEGALEKIYKNRFSALGMDVYPFDIQSPYFQKINESFFNKIRNRISPFPFIEDTNRELLRFVQNLQPDVILIFKGMELLPSTVAELKESSKILVNFNPDHPFRYFSRGSGNANVKDSLPYYDLHFSYSKKVAEEVSDKLNKPAFTIPFGFDETKKANITKELLDDIIFIGAYDKERARFFDKLGVNVKIFGNKKWSTPINLPKIIKEGYQGRSAVDQDYVDYTCSALGAINILREQNLQESSHNMRTFEVPGYGGLLLSNRTEEQCAFFEDKKEAFFFDSITELRDIIQFLKKNKAVVQKVKMNARERSVKADYSYRKRAMEMIKVIKEHI
jgi:spore maturation protein CgeB